MASSAERALRALEQYVSKKGGQMFTTEMGNFYKSSGDESDAFKAVFGNGNLKRVLETHPKLQFSKSGERDVVCLTQTAGSSGVPRGAAKESLSSSDRGGSGSRGGKGGSTESKNQSRSAKQGKGGGSRGEADQALAALERYVSKKGGQMFTTEMGNFYKSSGDESDAFKAVFGNGNLKRVLETHPKLQFSKSGERDVVCLTQTVGSSGVPRGAAKESLSSSDRGGSGSRDGKGGSTESKNQSRSAKQGKGGESRGAADQVEVKTKGGSGGNKAKMISSSSYKSESEISPDLQNFLKRLSLSGGGAILRQDDSALLDLWHRCWRAAASGAKFPYTVILDTLLSLPVSAVFSPTAKELAVVLLNLVRTPDTSVSNLKTMSTLEKVVDAIEHRLGDALNSINDTQDATDVAKTVGELPSLFRASTFNLLSTDDGALDERATLLLGRFNAAVKRIQTALKTLPTAQLTVGVTSNAVDEQQPWHGWHKNPTVGWLVKGDWLHSPQLRPQYDSVSNYIETLQRMMTLLTFYWGAGALWPKCRHRQGGGHTGDDSKCCNEPLMVMCGSSATANCSARQGLSPCGRKAQWRCARSSHLSHAICESCLRRQQASILGRSGNSVAAASSTDIYDAIVEREVSRREGQVFLLSGLTSRRPPTIEPNWKTSYRLKCSALVAVVRLDVPGEALNDGHPIQWAEIVPFSQNEGANQDFEHRSKKRLALRPLMSEDVSVLESEQFLQAGRRIAVIDLRVFVPEVVSVLGTMFQPSLSAHFSLIPFSGNLIGCGTPLPSIQLTPASDVEAVITEAIQGSEMKVLQRLSVEIRDKLCHDLAKLGRDANLYGTQLAAFTEALRCSLHCTQGPPGTGKSYVGVQLILALDRIREAAKESGQALGPIVVLSYKNHALDEVLLDLLQSPSCTPAMKRTLIRCGNPESEDLQPYREKNSQLERSAEEELSQRLSALRQANRTAKDWHDLGILLPLACAELKHQNYVNALEGIPILSEWAPGRAENNAERRDCRDGSNVVDTSISALRFLISKDCMQCSGSRKAYEVLKSISFAKETRDMNPLLRVANQLEEEAEHWIQKEVSSSGSPGIFVFTKFLQGATPPPRCQYHKEDGEEFTCTMVVSAPGMYCAELHGCCEPSGTCLERRTNHALGVKFCDAHRCKEAHHRPKKEPRPCHNISLPNSQCCSAHGCPLCKKVHAVQVFPKQPHACHAHQCMAIDCQFPQLNPGEIPFCKEHACSICQRPNEVILDMLRYSGSPFCSSHKCADNACMDSRLRGDQVFCPKHACRECKGRRKHVDPLCAASVLCKEHRCAHSDSVCPLSRSQGSDFCELHTCFICVRLGFQGNRGVVDEAPRNVCPGHILCAETLQDGTLCGELIAGNGPFCQAHRRQTMMRKKPANAFVATRECFCSGVTSKDKQCKTKGYAEEGRSFYCPPHADQAPESSSDSSDSDEEFFEIEQEALFSGAIGSWDNFADSEQSASTSGLAVRQMDEADDATDDDESLRRAIALSLLPNDLDGLAAVEAPPDSKTPPPRSVSGDLATEKAPVDAVSDNDIFQEVEENVGHEGVIEVVPVDLFSNDTFFPEEDEDMVWHEANAADIHPDELDYDEEGDQEIDMEQERLQQTLGEDLYASGDVDSEDDEFEDDIQPVPNTIVGLEEISSLEDFLERMGTWSWDMTTAQRWAEFGMLLRFASSSLKELKAHSESYVDEARQQRAQAAGQSFKKAHLIGATVVGATRRLEALRSAEPFAMVVEEACEVMEPTLMSVLSVRSLQKLELVGDHRQLPAFVQNCWFNLETTHPSIKVSLFERLVTGKNRPTRSSDEAEGVASFTCLDEQRRMRPAIADLTRNEYTDLVTIFDHSHTREQLVGDRAFLPKPLPPSFVAMRESWSHRGERVPGVIPQEYFWDIPNNSEGRPVSGLSACNYVEAEHVVALTSYLILCGVPPPSISIITPYKGQLMCIRRLLQKAGAISFSNFGGKGKGGKGKGKGGKGKGGKGKGKGGANGLEKRSGKGAAIIPESAEAASVIVSTVDRYQGDENDVVILSLVRTKPGNRFVALHNRYIVAASRARLGFFILGSTAAVETGSNGKPILHWSKLLEHLRTPRPNEMSRPARTMHGEHPNVSSNSQNQSRAESRVGSSITLCCPRHKDTSKLIQCPSDFPQNSTWSSFCSLPCNFRLSWCNHSCSLSCHSPQKQPHTAPSDCTHPLARPCPDHSDVPLLCGSLYSSSAGTNLDEALEHFPCDQPVKYERPECAHVVILQCHERTELENAGLSGFSLELCSEIVGDFVHPECNHVIRRPKCSERRRFEQKPPRCVKEVKIVKTCGCTAELECWQAVRELKSPSICTQAKECHRPRCSHKLSMRCHETTALRERWENHDGVSASVDLGVTVVDEGVQYGPSETTLLSNAPPCSVGVKFRGACGHISQKEEPCNVAFEMAEGKRPPIKCTHLTDFQSPICSHLVQAECSIKNCEAVGSFTSPFLASPRIDGQPVAHEDSLAPLTLFPALERRKLERACSSSVLIKRRCGHCTPMQCARLFRSVKSHDFPVCKEPVDRHLRCGHIVRVACEHQENEEPPCGAVVDDAYIYPCGVHSVRPGVCADLSALKALKNPFCPTVLSCHHYRCGHEVSVPCWLESDVIQPAPGKRIQSGKDGSGVVASGEVYCKSMDNVPQCNKPVTFKYTQCGHVKQGVPCYQAFEWAEAIDDDLPPCCHEVEVTSPVCGHVQLKVPCWEARLLSEWMPWSSDVFPMPEITDDFDVQGHGMTCRVFHHECTRPLPPPGQLSKSTLKCEEFSYVERSCGHFDRVPCAQVFLELDTGRCMEDIPEVCQDCNHETMTPCFQMQAREKSGLKSSCINKVMKLCQSCNINKVSTECSKQDVQCISEASCTLPCGHVVSWMCGYDGKAGEDPRISQDKCVACTLPLWKALKGAPDFTDDQKAALLFKLRKHALSQLPVGAKICDQVNEPDMVLDALFGAWMQVINVNIDLLQQSLENNTKDGLLQVRGPPRLDDLSSYDVVFVSTGRGGIKQCSTRYGQGTNTHLLSLGTLQREADANEDDIISIAVGVAFRYQALEEVQPFRPFRGGENAKKKSQKEETKSNKKRVQKLQAGFDHVVPLNDAGEPIASRRIYWLPGAVSKLFTLKIQLEEHESCLICGDETPVAKGFSCNNVGGQSHFTCDECFAQHVKSKVDSDFCELRLRKAANGHVFCPSRRTDRNGNAIDCMSSHISEADVLQHARSAFDAFLKNREELVTIDLRASITEEQKKLFEAEKERLAKMSAQEREIHKYRTHIVEEILTLKCPRPNCRAAFLDFDGCFALKCGACNCGFCGWCLAECGLDAHEHVAACPHKVGGQTYHGSEEQFKQAHKPRREREVVEYLRQIDDRDIQRRTAALSRKDLQDLGMHALMSEFVGAAAEEVQDAAARGAMELDQELAYMLQADDADA